MRPSQFPRVVVINLESRPDRWERISAQLNALGIVAERFNAIKNDTGWIGCALSHQSSVQTAIDEPWVLVLEDDCEFTEDFSKSYSQILYHLEYNMHGWEHFNGGPHLLHRDPVRPFIHEVGLFYSHGWTTHFALYNQWSYSRILHWTPRDGAIDNFYYELSKKSDLNFRSVSHLYHLAIQYESYSDILKQNKEYNDDFVRAKKILKSAFENYSKVGSRFRMLPAQHSGWKGNLVISSESDFVFNELHGSSGRYAIDGVRLVVKWDLYGQEVYFDVGGTWLQDSLVLK